MKFEGTITAISDLQSGKSKAGKEWQKIDCILVYDNSRPEYPKAIAFSVMNDKIKEFALNVGSEYEVEVDFSARDYNGKFYVSATAWRAVSKAAIASAAPSQPQPMGSSPAQNWQQVYNAPTPAPIAPAPAPAPAADDDGLPF